MTNVLRAAACTCATAASTLWLGGCGTPPLYESDRIASSDGKVIEAPDADFVLKHIQCELLDVVTKAVGERARANDIDKNGNPDHLQTSPLAHLLEHDYVADVNVTLEVTQNEGFNPQLSFILPVDHHTFGIGGSMTGTQHRTINEDVSFRLLPSHDQASCAQYSGDRLRGKLGLEGIVAAGLKSTRGNPLQNIPGASDKIGATIDFTIVYGINGAPNWTVTHFAGPFPGGSMLSYGYTVKDTLVLSLAPAAKAFAGNCAAHPASGLACAANGPAIAASGATGAASGVPNARPEPSDAALREAAEAARQHTFLQLLQRVPQLQGQ